LLRRTSVKIFFDMDKLQPRVGTQKENRAFSRPKRGSSLLDGLIRIPPDPFAWVLAFRQAERLPEIQSHSWNAGLAPDSRSRAMRARLE